MTKPRVLSPDEVTQLSASNAKSFVCLRFATEINKADEVLCGVEDWRLWLPRRNISFCVATGSFYAAAYHISIAKNRPDAKYVEPKAKKGDTVDKRVRREGETVARELKRLDRIERMRVWGQNV